MAKWSVPVDHIAHRFEGDLDKTVRAISLELFTLLLIRSPVDTGRFRGNWLVSFDDWPGGDGGGFGASVRDGGDREANARSAQEHAMRQASKFSKGKAGVKVLMVNNVPYSVELELGSSQQAPHGVVRVTAEEFAQAARNAARSVRYDS